MRFLYWLLMPLLMLPGFSYAADELEIDLDKPVKRGSWKGSERKSSLGLVRITVRGKICGGKELITEEYSSRIGREKEEVSIFHRLTTLKEGDGYYLTKEWTDLWESHGTSDLWLVRYRFVDGCYVKKQLHLKSNNNSSLGESDQGVSGMLYISKDESLILRVTLHEPRKANVIAADRKLIRDVVSKYSFLVYSTKSLEIVDRGELGENLPMEGWSDLLVGGIKYELFQWWVIKPRQN